MIFSDEEVEQDSGRSEAEEDAEPEHSPSTDAIPVSKINSSSAQLILVHICWLQSQFRHFVTVAFTQRLVCFDVVHYLDCSVRIVTTGWKMGLNLSKGKGYLS
jgi:hypothetical protein